MNNKSSIVTCCLDDYISLEEFQQKSVYLNSNIKSLFERIREFRQNLSIHLPILDNFGLNLRLVLCPKLIRLEARLVQLLNKTWLSRNELAFHSTEIGTTNNFRNHFFIQPFFEETKNLCHALQLNVDDQHLYAYIMGDKNYKTHLPNEIVVYIQHILQIHQGSNSAVDLWQCVQKMFGTAVTIRTQRLSATWLDSKYCGINPTDISLALAKFQAYINEPNNDAILNITKAALCLYYLHYAYFFTPTAKNNKLANSIKLVYWIFFYHIVSKNWNIDLMLGIIKEISSKQISLLLYENLKHSLKENDPTYFVIDFLTHLCNFLETKNDQLTRKLTENNISSPKQQINNHVLLALRNQFPALSKKQIEFMAHHHHPGQQYKLQHFCTFHNCCFETARYSLLKLANHQFYEQQTINNKTFVFIPTDKLLNFIHNIKP